MQSGLTLSSIVALFSALVVLAAIPSVSVLAVSTRAATSGLIHGVFTALGIVTGDIIFIIAAIGGLSFLAERMGSLFVLIKYLGGTYLIWLGIGLCRSKLQNLKTEVIVESSLLSSFLTGLSITLADQKATLFYLGFLPGFVDLSKISYLDTIIVIVITIMAVGGVKIAYALMAARVKAFVSFKISKGINIVAGCVMIAVGIWLMFKT